MAVTVDIAKLEIILTRADGYCTGGPFLINGWLIGTCGHGLLAVRSTDGKPYAGESKTLPDGAFNLINVELPAERLPMAKLRSLADIPADRPPCAICKSTGKVFCKSCKGSGEIDCECDECGNEHTKKCEECVGRGGSPCRCGWQVRKRYKRFIAVGDAAFCASMIGQYLFPLQAETFRSTQPKAEEAWIIGDDDWRIAFMPYRASAADKAAMPRLHLPQSGAPQ
jgi:hypothetical protein